MNHVCVNDRIQTNIQQSQRFQRKENIKTRQTTLCGIRFYGNMCQCVWEYVCVWNLIRNLQIQTHAAHTCDHADSKWMSFDHHQQVCLTLGWWKIVGKIHFFKSLKRLASERSVIKFSSPFNHLHILNTCKSYKKFHTHKVTSRFI